MCRTTATSRLLLCAPASQRVACRAPLPCAQIGFHEWCGMQVDQETAGGGPEGSGGSLSTEQPTAHPRRFYPTLPNSSIPRPHHRPCPLVILHRLASGPVAVLPHCPSIRLLHRLSGCCPGHPSRAKGHWRAPNLKPTPNPSHLLPTVAGLDSRSWPATSMSSPYSPANLAEAREDNPVHMQKLNANTSWTQECLVLQLP